MEPCVILHLRVLPLSSSFRSLIHVELNFVYGVRSESSFLLLHADIQSPRSICCKDVIFQSQQVAESSQEHHLSLQGQSHVPPQPHPPHAKACLRNRDGFPYPESPGALMFCPCCPLTGNMALTQACGFTGGGSAVFGCGREGRALW